MRIACSILLIVLVAACTPGGRTHETPPLQSFAAVDRLDANSALEPVVLTGALLGKTITVSTAQPVLHWWEQFNDPQLTTLIKQALQHNLDIKQAVASVRAAKALRLEERLDYLPVIEGVATYNNVLLSQQNPNLPPGIDRTNQLYNTGLSMVWELDLFGRVSAAVDIADANYQARRADLAGAYVSVAAEVADAYMALRGAQLQAAVANRNAANQSETLSLTRQLMEAGEGTSLDVSRAQAQLALTKALIPTFTTQEAAATNRLAVLTGQAPGSQGLVATLNVGDTAEYTATSVNAEYSFKKAVLPAMPAAVTVGDATSLLRRRPDIVAAEYALAASTAAYNLNVADLFPRVTILGGIGYEATDVANLGADGATNYSVGPSITWAGFNLAAVKARIDAADAEATAALAAYEQQVLQALEEVASNITAVRQSQEEVAALQVAVTASEQSTTLAQQRFDAGIDSFLDVLITERDALTAATQLAVSEIGQRQALVALYRALGGGWQEVAQRQSSEK